MKPIPHSWRKLPIGVRLRVPQEYFEIPEEDIKRIRLISDSRKRLTESARLQYEIFKDIHTDLTAWIAGYASDVTIRQKFGSTQKIRDIFIQPILKSKDFTPSWGDRRRNVTLPEEMTPELAEECGIHIGDGNLYIGYEKAWVSHSYTISGDLKNESLFHKDHIVKLMKNIYNCKGHFRLRVSKNSIDSVYKSKLILEFKRDFLNFPVGGKTNIKIPEKVLGDKIFEQRCLCGIFDTDFNINSQMQINGRMASLFLLRQVCQILSKHHIRHHYREVYRYENWYGDLKLNKDSSLNILEGWGLNNQKQISKYLVWKETGKFFPFTATYERIAFLEGRLTLDALEDISNKRRKEKTSAKINATR